MGANLILACIPVPRQFFGEALRDEMTRRVTLMDDDQLREVAGCLEDIEGEEATEDYLVDDEEYATDEFGQTIFDLDKIRVRLLQAVRVVCEGGAESTELAFGSLVMLVTGGQSWGDSPSDDYNDYRIVAEANLFEQELDVIRQRMNAE